MSVLTKVMASMNQPHAPVAAPVVSVETDHGAAQLAAENEKLKRRVAELSADKAKLEQSFQSISQKYESATVERDRERVRSTLIQAATKHEAVDPEEMADLLLGRVKIDGGKVVSIDDPAVDAGAVVAKYLETKPHHAKARGSAGTGASRYPATPPAPPAPAKHDTKTREGATAALRESILGSIQNNAANPTPKA